MKQIMKHNVVFSKKPQSGSHFNFLSYQISIFPFVYERLVRLENFGKSRKLSARNSAHIPFDVFRIRFQGRTVDIDYDLVRLDMKLITNCGFRMNLFLGHFIFSQKSLHRRSGSSVHFSCIKHQFPPFVHEQAHD